MLMAIIELKVWRINKMIHNADAISIKNLFDVYYEIPEYQREYSWRLENWENLFNDLNESDKDYFFGYINMYCRWQYPNASC